MLDGATDDGTAGIARADDEVTLQHLRAITHELESNPIASRRKRIETTAIVCNSELQAITRRCQVDFDFRGASMPYCVGERFLRNPV